MKQLPFLAVLVVFSIVGLLSGCGGGSGGGNRPVVLNGVFKDSSVQGLSYSSGNQKGVTGPKGEFKYEENGNIAFSVGAVPLGIAKAKNVMTPKDLVVDGEVDTPEVLNRVRFLMMLDKDNKPDNGIQISPSVQQKAKSWAAIDFKDAFPSEKAFNMVTEASVADRITHAFPSVEDAKTHFTRTLDIIKSTERCVDAGAFSGTFSGTEQGNIVFILDPATGGIKGSFFNTAQSGNHIPVAINEETVIDYETQSRSFTSLSTTGLRFTGSLKAGNNALQGTWVDKNDNTKKGTFSAQRIVTQSGANFRYNATYQGNTSNDMGAVVLDKTGNRISGKMFNVKAATTLDITGGVSNEQFVNTKLSDGGAVTGFITESGLSGTIKEKSGNTDAFTGTGCKLN